MVKEKNPVSMLNDDKCEELFSKGKFGYKVEREIDLSSIEYFNQRLLNHTQNFS